MTGTELIALIRRDFGELEELTVTDEAIERWVNQALQTLYQFLPLDELRPLWDSRLLVLEDGEVEVNETDDRIIAVTVDDTPVMQVSLDVIQNIDISPLFVPLTPVWARETRKLWVRPKDIEEVTLTHVDPPTPISDFSQELDWPPRKWVGVLSDLTVSSAYAQEEDVEQASWYYQRALQRIGEEVAEAKPQEQEA